MLLKFSSPVLFASLLLFPIFSGAADPVQLTRAADAPRSVLAHASYTTRFSVKNRGTKRMILRPSVADLPHPGAECAITDFTRAPIEPDATGSIDIRCEWGYFGDARSRRRTTLSFEAIPFGMRNLTVEAAVYDPARSTLEPDQCAARKKNPECAAGPKLVRRLCFVGHDIRDLGGHELHLFELCNSAFFERYEVGSLEQIRQTLAGILENTCDKIESITILDHGLPGLQSITETKGSAYLAEYLTSESVDKVFEAGRYECLLTEKPKLVFGGCSVGAGCEGRLFVAAAGRSLAPSRPLEVIAADTTAISGWSRVTSRTGSENGRDIVLMKSGELESWQFKGFHAGPAPSLLSVCRSDFQSGLHSLQARASAISGDRWSPESKNTVDLALADLGRMNAELTRFPESASSVEIAGAFKSKAFENGGFSIQRSIDYMLSVVEPKKPALEP